MNASAQGPTQRGKYQGLLQILEFNRRSYLRALLFISVGMAVLLGISLSGVFRLALAVGISVTALWSFLSLAVSHWVYDHSRICEWEWIPGLFPNAPRRWANIHAGFDESSPALCRLFPDAEGTTLDIFDPREMTEPSIAAARSKNGDSVSTTKADFRDLSIGNDSLDAVFLLFAAHEIRQAKPRAEFFCEVRRVLKADGCVILAEHLRDWRNFLAFGPGFTHFHSRRTWLAAVKAANLSVAREFNITPFVRVFVLRPAP